jgi:hypothetical protein
MRAWTLRSLPASSVLFFACSSTDGDVETGNRGTILLSDSANYNTTSSLTLPRVETAAGVDLEICWEQMTDDIRCHDVRPAEDVDNVGMLRFVGLTPEQVQQRLGAGELPQSELDAYFDYNTDHSGTCTQLSSMEFFGTPIQIEQDARGEDATLVLVFTQGTTPGVGALNMLIFAPTSDSDNTRIDAMPGCGILDFSADIQSSQPLEVVNEAPWIVDWRDVTVDGLGNDLATTGIDRILLGYYEGTTVADLEAQIFDLEIIATEMWEVELEEAAFTADLAQAKSRTSGAAFAGFDRSDGTWAVALMCSTCQNPAPLVLSVLEPTAGGT